MEPPQPQYVDAHEQHHVESPQQQHAEPAMKDEDEGFPGGPYDLSLLPNFGNHVAFKLWNDRAVSII